MSAKKLLHATPPNGGLTPPPPPMPKSKRPPPLCHIQSFQPHQPPHPSHQAHQLHQFQQQLRHSQSSLVGPRSDAFGSYATLPYTAAGPDQQPPAIDATGGCAYHHNAGHNRWYSTPTHTHPGGPNYGAAAAYNQYNQSSANQSVTPAAAHLPSGCLCAQYVAYQQHLQRAAAMQERGHARHKPAYGNGGYLGFELGNHLTDEEDSAFPGFHDREFHLLHRNIPALRRTGVDNSAIRQYFYPDGGWGWIICGIAFLVHILTTGLQLSYGLLLFYAVQHLHNVNGIEWLGALSWSVSMLVTPFVVAFCRKKSTRLLAVIGGLVLPLGMLFTSFATELGQIVFSYGFVFGIGVSMVRESSTIMLGNYFKRRRQFVEMVAMSGEGVGIALFSVILKEGVGKAGWRLGLQIIAAIVSIGFFIGLLYRPASLYHPKRRAIQHLKNQLKKLRKNKMSSGEPDQSTTQYMFLDLSTLKSTTVRVLLMTAGVAGLGIYTPMFLMSLNAAKEGCDTQDLVLLQTFLGLSSVVGVGLSGALSRRPIHIRRFVITTQVLSQVFILTVALAILALSFVMGYKGLCILAWFYGIGFGGFRYSFKILALERVKLKQFSKTWGLIKGVEAIPVLISVPLTSFLNDYSLKYGRAGYYICSAATAIAGIIIFFISYSNTQSHSQGGGGGGGGGHRKLGNGSLPTASLLCSAGNHLHNCKVAKAAAAVDYMYDHGFDRVSPTVPELFNRSCISLNQMDTDYAYRHAYYAQQARQNNAPCGQHQLPYDWNPARDSFGSLRHGRRVVEADFDVWRRPAAQYSFGQGSVGARAGKRLQKSLSYIQNPHCYNGNWNCNCRQSNWAHWTRDRSDLDVSQHRLASLNSYNPYWDSNSRSRSVPEGLSSIAQQCTCHKPSREIIYLQRPNAHHQSRELLFRDTPTRSQMQAAAAAAQQQHRRTHSNTKPHRYSDQVTTAV